MKTTEFKLKQMEIEKSLSILEYDYAYLLRSGFLVLFIQNIILSITFLLIGFLTVVSNPYILNRVIFYLIHVDVIAALILSISFKLTRNSFQKIEYNSLSSILWVCWIITSLFYRFLIAPYFSIINFKIPFNVSKTYYGLSTILFALSASLFCLAIFFSAITLSENYLLKNKWLFIGFGLLNLIITNLYILSNLIPKDGHGGLRSESWYIFVRIGDFMFYIKLYGVPIIAIISLAFVLKEIQESINSARLFFIKNNHSMSKIWEKCLKVKEYREIIDTHLDIRIEQVLQENKIDLEALEIFSSRASDFTFILFVPRKIRKLNRLIIEFLQISIAKPETKMLFFIELTEKKQKKLHSFKWKIEGSIEDIIEFNFNELPVIFIIDNSSKEIGKIEGEIPKKAKLLGGLIFYLDIGELPDSM
ncbi:MAG TPA: hypothetical protein VMX55_12440 [candidate division Zixibacteria bacterium]|nr:hypothetical protein [candidate division Zixibacteria bacterium]